MRRDPSDTAKPLTARPAAPGETTALAAIQRSAALAAFGHIFPPEEYPYPDEAMLRIWWQRLDDPCVTVVVAERAGEPVGVAAFTVDTLDALWVVPTEWGKGPAVVLHDHVVESLRSAGRAKCELWVLAENHQARRFYERHGWRQDGRTSHAPFPPRPLRMGYRLDLIGAQAERDGDTDGD